MVSPFINSAAGKEQFVVSIDNVVQDTKYVSISSNKVTITTELMTAANTVKIRYTKSVNQSLAIQSSTNDAYAPSFQFISVQNTLSPIKQSIQVTSKKRNYYYL